MQQMMHQGPMSWTNLVGGTGICLFMKAIPSNPFRGPIIRHLCLELNFLEAVKQKMRNETHRMRQKEFPMSLAISLTKTELLRTDRYKSRPSWTVALRSEESWDITSTGGPMPGPIAPPVGKTSTSDLTNYDEDCICVFNFIVSL